VQCHQHITELVGVKAISTLFAPVQSATRRHRFVVRCVE
jgi:hypothetical protein